MSDLSVDKLKALLAKDSNYTRFKEVVKRYSLSEDMDNLMSEIETLHRTRKCRKLHSINPNPRDIVDATLEDSSFRSRAVEILMRMMRSQRAIEKAIDSVSGYLATEYGDYVDARTKAERERILRTINQRAYQYLDALESSIAIIREFTGDIDHASFAVKHAIEGLSLLYNRSNVV